MMAILDLRSFLEKRFMSALLAVAMSHAAVAAQSPARASGDACEGPANDVRVMALQDPDNQPAYVLAVKNNSKQSILALTIGNGEKPELRVIPYAVPVQIAGPAGWKASHVFQEESMFMHWVWSTDKPELSIAPGELASGFKLVLPPFPPKAASTKYSDGTPVRPVKVTELPFRVYLSDGKCEWGRIVPLVVGAR
jgi:hypothetical protein